MIETREIVSRMVEEYDSMHVSRLKERLMSPMIITGEKEEIWREAGQLGVAEALHKALQRK